MRLLHYVRNDNDLRIFYQQYGKSLDVIPLFITSNRENFLFQKMKLCEY